MRITKSQVLAALGMAGVVATAVMAAKNTIKAKEILDTRITEDSTKLEVVKTVLPAYLPTIATGAATIACIAGSSILSKKSQASLASAYALSNETFKKYRSKLIELHGEEADKEIREAIVRTNPEYRCWGVDAPDKKLTFYDDIGDRTFTMYERELMDAEYHFNRNFALSGEQTLNQFYEMIGLDPIDEGDKIGWNICDGICWVDIQHTPIKSKTGKTIYRLDYVFSPEEMDSYY